MRRKSKTARKTTIVLTILGLGGIGAVPFLRPTPHDPNAVRHDRELEISLRGVPLQLPAESGTSPAVGLHDEDPVPAAVIGEKPESRPFPADLGQTTPPPEFTSTYPPLLEPVEPVVSRPNGMAIRPVSAEARLASEAAARKHRLVDGDTLSKLARRYLGNAERAGDIFDANRDLLGTPEALPLGVEIYIPAR